MIRLSIVATFLVSTLVPDFRDPRWETCVPILLYHQVSSTSNALGPFVVSPAEFERQMIFLSSKGYRSISLDEFVDAHRQGKSLTGRCFLLTFDDGYRDNYTEAFPILQRFDLKATIFLVSDWLLQGNNGCELPVSILRLGDIAEMSQSGITFGAHTCSHRSLTALHPEEAELEIKGSREALEKHLNLDVEFFSYPYGHSDTGTRSIVQACGFKAAFATENGSDDLFNLRRIVIQADDTLLDFKLKVQSWDGGLLRVLKWAERKLGGR